MSPPFINPFISVHTPILWAALLREFGLTVEYWLDHDSAQAAPVEGIWKEGAEGETLSPGRYSIFWIQDGALARNPTKGDAIARNGVVFDVVDVRATAYGYSRLTLQEGL